MHRQTVSRLIPNPWARRPMRRTLTVSPARTNLSISVKAGWTVFFPPNVAVKARSKAMPPSCRTVFWSLLTRR
ncbi:hypothetical protein [Deinococcus altitudinis]|uniref:hypothetical protein n=1 Tax=Deinococcus altitudinis TaxID=468914 RepID=UPI00389124BE